MEFWYLVIGLIVSGLLFFLAYQFQSKGFFIASLVTLAATIVLVSLLYLVVTEEDKIRQRLAELTYAVQSNQVSDTMTFISKSVPETRTRVQTEMPNYRFSKCFIMDIVELEFDSDEAPTRATVVFKVFYQVTVPSLGGGGAGIRFVELEMTREADEQWYVTDYAHWAPNETKETAQSTY